MPALHNYQLRAVEHIRANRGAGLFVGMGLGKTAATLTAVDQLIDEGDVFSVLVIAPKRVAEETWPAEAAKWTPHIRPTVIAGTPSERTRLVMNPSPLHVIGRDNLQWLVKTFGQRWPYDMIVVDESSGFKDSGSKRFKSLKKVLPGTARVVILTGTPGEDLLSLWSQLFLLDGGQRLGRTFTAYKQAFFDSDYMGWKFTPKTGAEKEIHERVSDICLSMTAADYLDLPERIDNIVKVHLDSTQRAAYDALRRDFLIKVEGGVVTAANAAVLAGKLQQLAGGEIYREDKSVVTVHDAKIEALAEIIEAAQGRPVLVFYQFRHELERIKRVIRGAEELDVKRFMVSKQKVALAHPASAGHGLNLQSGSSEMVWYSLPWSLELYQQANARLHRQGQTQSVVIHHILTDGTIDEDVMSALADKATTQDRLIEALKRRL